MSYRPNSNGLTEFCTVCGVSILVGDGVRAMHERQSAERHAPPKDRAEETDVSEWTRGYRQGIVDLWERIQTDRVLAEQVVYGCARLIRERSQDAVMLSEWQRAYLP